MNYKSFLIIFLLVFSFFCVNFVLAEEKQGNIELKDYPVYLGNKVVFNINTGVGVFTPEERASAIKKRLENLIKDPLFKTKDLIIVDGENTSDIVYDNNTIVSFGPKDEKYTNRSTKELAEFSLKGIKESIKEYRKTFNLKCVLMGILYSLLATIALFIIVSLLNRFIGIIYRTVVKLEDEKIIKDLKFQKVNILSSQKIEAIIKLFLIIVQILIISVFLYFYITIVLSFFPWTTGQSGQLYKNVHIMFSGIFTTIAFYLPNLLIILVIIASAIFVMKFLKFVFNEIKRETIQFSWFYKEWSTTTYNLFKFFIICLAIALIFPYIPGSETNAFRGVSIFLGILFSLGSTTAISNVVAGIILTYTRAFDMGERVKIGSFVGDIVEKTMFVVRIKTPKNELISIPHSKVLSSEIINYSDLSKTFGLIINAQITIGYDVPWRDVHKALIAAAGETENITKERPPFVLQKALNDFNVTYEINAYTDRTDLMPKTYSSLYQNIQDKFNEAGIEIMSPHYNSLRDGNKVAIPDGYLPETYKSPEFNVHVSKEQQTK